MGFSEIGQRILKPEKAPFKCHDDTTCAAPHCRMKQKKAAVVAIAIGSMMVQMTTSSLEELVVKARQLESLLNFIVLVYL